MKKLKSTKEFKRLNQEKPDNWEPYIPWQKWGPYVSERAWGTVREDYSESGDAWNYLSFDDSKSKAFRWGEDGIAGFCDYNQQLCLTFAFWNHSDPILKERLFGLSSPQGNHGEDVKEVYYHLEALPSHAYMKFLYRYPQKEFPYQKIVDENAKRTTHDREYELVDTGIFNSGDYFDIVVEYAKAKEEDIYARLEITNHSKKSAVLDVIPQLVCRNRWSWDPEYTKRPSITANPAEGEFLSAVCDFSEADPVFNPPFSEKLEKVYLYADQGAEMLFTENDTRDPENWFELNTEPPALSKDAFHRYIINKEDCVAKEPKGTKMGLHYRDLSFEPGEVKVINLRLTNKQDDASPLLSLKSTFTQRREECEEFYHAIRPSNLSEEDQHIHRAALSGLLWGKQYYHYRVNHWLKGDNPERPPSPNRLNGRNHAWKHLVSGDVMMVCDPWEYPWFAAWDMAFHAQAMAVIDIQFAKRQVELMHSINFQHPNGQLPGCEWDFSDINPPVLPWAALQLYEREYKHFGKKDTLFLARCFHKALMQFSWWINHVDSQGNNIFEGGFLGLDNISLFDRSEKKGSLEQSDGTGWMGMLCLVMMRIALDLSQEDPSYEPLAVLFFQHFVYIKKAIFNAQGNKPSLWNEEDGFFYDVVREEDGSYTQLKVLSFVGIIPLFASCYVEKELIDNLEVFKRRFYSFLENKEDLCGECALEVEKDGKGYYLFSLVSKDQFVRVMDRIWNPEGFLSDYGIRSLSKYHKEHPFTYDGKTIQYEPGESVARLKGGNSNWRGPIWLPVNYLLLTSIHVFEFLFGDELKVSPKKQKPMTLTKLRESLRSRLLSIFRLKKGKRPYLNSKLEQKNPDFRDNLLFYEHFDGDTGRGLGASHQTGWTALIAKIIEHENSC